MALTRVSPALFQVSNNITSVTVGGSANTISLTFDSNGVITGATNNAVSVANTAITGNIISSQITSNPTLYGNVSVTGVIAVGGATPTTNGSGITFPATQNASSDANTLDDYEEGTWTPVISGFTTAISSVTYSSQLGNYTKIGNQVFLQGAVAWSSKSGGSGIFVMTGLPFTTVTTNGASILNIEEYTGFTLPNSGTQLGGEIFSNLAYFVASGSANAGGSVNVTGVANSGYYYFQITYRTT